MNRNSTSLASIFACSFIFSPVLFADFQLDDCSGIELKQPCQYLNAQHQFDCLSGRVNKINSCNARILDYEQQLDSHIRDEIETYGLTVLDPLKKNKADHLSKLKAFESVLKWHDENVNSVSAEYVRFVKDFLDTYKKAEKRVEGRFQAFSYSANITVNYLDLINIRFDVQALQREESGHANRYIEKSTRLIGNLKGIEGFIKAQLTEYGEYLSKNQLSSIVPVFNREIAFARQVAEYAQNRAAVIDKEAALIVQRIDVIIIEQEKAKIKRDKEIDFRDGRFIARETSFLRDVNVLIDNALIKSDKSNFGQLEYLGGRYKGIQQLMTLDFVCDVENLRQPQNDWLGWGCEKYGELRDLARNRMANQLPFTMKHALARLESQQPNFEIEKQRAALKTLEAGKLEIAIGQYDQLLSHYSLERK